MRLFGFFCALGIFRLCGHRLFGLLRLSLFLFFLFFLFVFLRGRRLLFDLYGALFAAYLYRKRRVRLEQLLKQALLLLFLPELFFVLFLRLQLALAPARALQKR